jgi:hypothetical protein
LSDTKRKKAAGCPPTQVSEETLEGEHWLILHTHRFLLVSWLGCFSNVLQSDTGAGATFTFSFFGFGSLP